MGYVVKSWVKSWGKYIAIMFCVAAIVVGLYCFGEKGDNQGVAKKESKSFLSSIFSSDDKDYITVGTNTYAGFLPMMYLNGGLEPTEDCVLYKETGLKMKVVVQDNFQAGRAAFRNGDIDIIYCTGDALPVEMSEGSDMSDARFFNVSNWSRGADAIVVNKNITSVGSLIGKVVACSEGTASHTLLLNTLETNGIGYDKVNKGSKLEKDKVNIKVVEDGLAAAVVFKAGQCDAAVVYSPDDQDIVASIPGSKVLVSTKQASSIICDGLIAKQSWLDNNAETVSKFVSALLRANVKMNNDQDALRYAAKAFAKSYGTDEKFAIDGSKNIYYCTLGDEMNFFGMNPSYTGMQGQELYSKMARTYSGLGLCKSPLSWNKVSDTSVIEALSTNQSAVGDNQEPEQKRTFTAANDEVKSAKAKSTKKVTIEYPVNGIIL